MVNRLSDDDAAFFEADQRGSTDHVVFVLVLERGEHGLDYQRLMTTVEERLQFAPRYRQCVRTGVGLSHPAWVDDHDFDITYHVRRSALPSPGADEQLYDLVERLISRPLDPTRPLWEMNLVEGLSGGRVAVITKTHRAVVSASSPDISEVLLDDTVTPDHIAEDIWLPEREPGGVELAVAELMRLATHPWRVAETAYLFGPSRLAGRAIAGVTRRARDLLGGSASAPQNALNGPVGNHRRFAVVSVSIDRIESIAADDGVSVDVIVLAALSGALRRWLASRVPAVSSSESVRVMLPDGPAGTAEPHDVDIDRRWVADGLRGTVVDLPVGESNPSIRIAHISHSSSKHRQVLDRRFDGRPMPSAATVHALAARAVHTLRNGDFNVPFAVGIGSSGPRYLAGNRLLAALPVPVLANDRVLAIGATAYDGDLHFAFTADRDAVWDLETLPGYVEESLDELDERTR